MAHKSGKGSRERRKLRKKAERRALKRAAYAAKMLLGKNTKKNEGKPKKIKRTRFSYPARWGHDRYRIIKGHPNRVARQMRALARQPKVETQK